MKHLKADLLSDCWQTTTVSVVDSYLGETQIVWPHFSWPRSLHCLHIQKRYSWFGNWGVGGEGVDPADYWQIRLRFGGAWIIVLDGPSGHLHRGFVSVPDFILNSIFNLLFNSSTLTTFFEDVCHAQSSFCLQKALHSFDQITARIEILGWPTCLINRWRQNCFYPGSRFVKTQPRWRWNKNCSAVIWTW